MISMTDKEFIYKFDKDIEFSYEELKAICHGHIGKTHKEVNDCGEFTRIFQVDGRWFRARCYRCLYSLAELWELQSNYEYIRSLKLDEFAEYLDKFGAYYKSRDGGIPLDEIKAMLVEYKKAF